MEEQRESPLPSDLGEEPFRKRLSSEPSELLKENADRQKKAKEERAPYERDSSLNRSISGNVNWRDRNSVFHSPTETSYVLNPQDCTVSHARLLSPNQNQPHHTTQHLSDEDLQRTPGYIRRGEPGVPLGEFSSAHQLSSAHHRLDTSPVNVQLGPDHANSCQHYTQSMTQLSEAIAQEYHPDPLPSISSQTFTQHLHSPVTRRLFDESSSMSKSPCKETPVSAGEQHSIGGSSSSSPLPLIVVETVWSPSTSPRTKTHPSKIEQERSIPASSGPELAAHQGAERRHRVPMTHEEVTESFREIIHRIEELMLPENWDQAKQKISTSSLQPVISNLLSKLQREEGHNKSRSSGMQSHQASVSRASRIKTLSLPIEVTKKLDSIISGPPKPFSFKDLTITPVLKPQPTNYKREIRFKNPIITVAESKKMEQPIEIKEASSHLTVPSGTHSTDGEQKSLQKTIDDKTKFLLTIPGSSPTIYSFEERKPISAQKSDENNESTKVTPQTCPISDTPPVSQPSASELYARLSAHGQHTPLPFLPTTDTTLREISSLQSSNPQLFERSPPITSSYPQLCKALSSAPSKDSQSRKASSFKSTKPQSQKTPSPKPSTDPPVRKTLKKPQSLNIPTHTSSSAPRSQRASSLTPSSTPPSQKSSSSTPSSDPPLQKPYRSVLIKPKSLNTPPPTSSSTPRFQKASSVPPSSTPRSQKPFSLAPRSIPPLLPISPPSAFNYLQPRQSPSPASSTSQTRKTPTSTTPTDSKSQKGSSPLTRPMSLRSSGSTSVTKISDSKMTNEPPSKREKMIKTTKKIEGVAQTPELEQRLQLTQLPAQLTPGSPSERSLGSIDSSTPTSTSDIEINPPGSAITAVGAAIAVAVPLAVTVAAAATDTDTNSSSERIDPTQLPPVQSVMEAIHRESGSTHSSPRRRVVFRDILEDYSGSQLGRRSSDMPHSESPPPKIPHKSDSRKKKE